MENTGMESEFSAQLQNRTEGKIVDTKKIDAYIMVNKRYFPEEKIPYMKEKMRAMDNAKFELITSTQLKDPTILLIVSLFLGFLGIDRFMLGNIGYGIVKILFFWIGILSIIDWFIIMKKTREYNFNKISVLM